MLAIRALTAPRRYIRPWYLAYLPLGMVIAAMLPVTLPLTIEALAHSLATVVYVMGAYNFGLLTSPLWGMVAERIKADRKPLPGGFLPTAAGTLGMLLSKGPPSWPAGPAARARAAWANRLQSLPGYPAHDSN